MKENMHTRFCFQCFTFLVSFRFQMHALTYWWTLMNIVKSVTYADWFFSQAMENNYLRFFSSEICYNLNYFCFNQFSINYCIIDKNCCNLGYIYPKVIQLKVILMAVIVCFFLSWEQYILIRLKCSQSFIFIFFSDRVFGLISN